MVASGDNFLADVVFLIEATAHISPYVESLKTNYIVPTLEYFSETLSDERDCGLDSNPNSTLYGIVTFMSNDCRPDSASACYAPTSNSYTCLQWLEKIQFIGGAGNPSSHIAEGLSTAISLLDDFQAIREKANEKSSKYCILICNSTPYLEPAVESVKYCGYTIDQLLKVVQEKNINFSIFSPRKINFLYKLFENAGGNLQNALTKNYAKDRRHLVLLNGFHLQEKPMSPSEQMGTKRPLSPSSNNSNSFPNQQICRNPQLSSLISNENQFGSHSKMGSDSVGSVRVGSPWSVNSNVPSPSQGPRNPSNPPTRARAPTPQISNVNLHQMMTPVQSPGQMSNFASQASPASKPPQVNPGNVPLRPANPNINQIRLQQTQSPFPAPQAPSPSQPQPSPMNIRAAASPMQQNSAPSPMSQSQQQFMQQQQQLNHPPMNPIPQGQNMINMNQMNNMQAGLSDMNPVVSPMIPGQRTKIWSGTIEYPDKSQPNMPNPQGKMFYHIDAHITYQPNNNEPEFTAERWPDKLLINTVPKQLINRLSPIIKNNSYRVDIHFSGDSPGIQKLIKAMCNNTVGCIQLPNPANIRIIIILYMPDKKIFVGFIPHNQDEFMTSMKELIESHKKEQQVKQQQQQKINVMNQMQMSMGHQQQIPQLSQGQATNQMPNAQPQLAQMSGPLPIQISHGQMGQSAQANASQLMSSNVNNLFQLQQSNANLQPNANINTVAQSGLGSMPQSNNPPSGSGVLLNQNFNSAPGTNQAKSSGFVAGSNNNMGPAATGASNIQNTGVNTLQQTTHQANMQNLGQQPMMPPSSTANQPAGQQFNMMAAPAAGMNLPAATTTSPSNAQANRGFVQHERDREQNLMAIRQLKQTLEEAQRKEMEYQQQLTVDPSKPMIPNAPLQQQQQQSQANNGVRHQLQHQLQQKQHLQQQQQQVNSMNNTVQLRHLLQQQQQMRSMNPARMQNAGGQPQILMQQQGGGPMQQPPPQQQQFRYQSPIQGQQQQQPAQGAPGQTHNRNFYDESSIRQY